MAVTMKTAKTSELTAALLQKLDQLIDDRLPQNRGGQVRAFAHAFYSTAADEDLLSWRLEDLYGATLSGWEYLQEFTFGQPKVRVYNPEFEEHGWQSSHTIVQVLSIDLPFTLDSIRVELNRRNLGIHTVHNSVLTLKRDQKHFFAGFLKSDTRSQHARHETLISIEIDRHTDPQMLQDLERELNDVLYQVSMVVDDFQPMLDQVDQLLEMYDQIAPAKQPDGLKETREFIHWLKLRFTFLGYDEYELTGGKGKKLEATMGSQLGLLKYCDEHCRAELVNDEQRGIGQFTLIPELLSFTKSPSKSRVHRPAFPDYITVKRFDKQGRVIGESRFLGLYTSEVYLGNARQIPVVREKVNAVLARSGRHKYSHDWKELLQILEVHPRDDLFQASEEELYATAMGILHIHERRQIRLFLRRDSFGQYVSCLVYAPRDIYSTEFRLRVEHILLSELGCNHAEFNTYFSESILARTHFVLRSDGVVPQDIDVESLQRKVQQAAKSWSDELYDALVETLGEEKGIAAFNHYGRGFPSSYKDDFSARTAVVDIQHINSLDQDNILSLSFYHSLERENSGFNFKLFNLGNPLPLSDVLPILENLGLRIIDEHPYAVQSYTGKIWIHDFNLVSSTAIEQDTQQIKKVFQEAFMKVWQGEASNDEFNKLVLMAGLSWRQVTVLRSYASYMKQIRFPISGAAISHTLNNYGEIARLLIELFEWKFDPKRQSDQQMERINQQIVQSLDRVVSLNDDKVIRQIKALIEATLRTNYFQLDSQGKPKEYLSLKLLPGLVPQMPEPKPLYEIFVHSPRLEGVHLRGGKVARGGLRWSDREEDFRTEVLGLVKAQQVKNAVIVPVGAKGGFVARKLNSEMDREQMQAEGIACYRTFISALLDITDNLIDGEAVKPLDVVCYDEDDPYLVVAADKGTATFSDIANEIASSYKFWLDDAFASGGSQGYDHKKMGITAKGAWVSVERHFRELGINISKTDFSVVGVGDMSGDVFGNGMLLSQHICLKAAFNHMHIFVDPKPDAASSWQERKRLFDLPRSGWDDYDSTLISKGGGVFKRSAKSIAISPEMKACFDIEEDKLAPNDLIVKILCASFDLFWNGGIGTYVKSSNESHADVGDKANDSVRVDARDLRCRVIGEGGNLGITQQARMEYALCFGRVNTDFIDNAGGVDCSDHEVNIKILLNDVVRNGDMTGKQRNKLLAEMTEDISCLVLENNYRQVQAISLEQSRAVDAMAENRRFINALESEGRLHRALEFIPEEEVLSERQVAGVGLTRPELAVLVSYSKAELKERLVASSVPDDPYLARELVTAFPQRLAQEFGEPMQNHQLRREIVATQLANNMVNYMGFKFVDRLRNATRADIGRISRAYVLAREVFDMQQLWHQIEALDYQVDASIQLRMMDELQYLIRRTTRWFITNRPAQQQICPDEVNLFRQTIAQLGGELGRLLCGKPKHDWHESFKRYLDAAVPESLASVIAGTRCLYTVLNIIEVAAETDVPVEQVGRVMFEVGERLDLHWLIGSLNELERDNHWQALAKESFRDDIDAQQRAILTLILKQGSRQGEIETLLQDWWQQYRQPLHRWQTIVSDLKAAERRDYAMFTVAISELAELTRSCQ